MNNNMSIIIRCDCGNILELKPKMDGHQFYLDNEIRNSKFTLSSLDIELSADLEEIEDLDEIEVSLGGIRIDCDKCNDYIVIEDFK